VGAGAGAGGTAMPEAARARGMLDPAGEGEAEQEEEFYESLDRILSSSCSSTSASASDDDADHRRRSSRRHHLLHQHHHNPPPSSRPDASSAYDVWISEPTSVEERRRLLLQRLGLASDPPPPSPPRRSPSPPVSAPASPPAPAEEPRSGGGGLGRPPLARNPSSSGGEQQCRIRNLDDGTEFEVGEVHEEEVVREVGTGRHLTFEEFELCVGRSPIVHELMKRTTTAASASASDHAAPASSRPRRKAGGGWLRGIRQLAGTVAYGRRGADDRDKEKEREARRLSSATDDSLDGSGSRNVGRVRVRQYGKTCKELTGLFMTQELAAHSGSVWCINFSLDGRYLATAGEDRVIHVWEVCEGDRKGELLGEASVAKENGGGCSPFLAVVGNDSPEISALSLSCADGGYVDKKRRPRKQSNRKSVGSDHLVVPECVFGFRDKPVCSLLGHAADVLDLSWSKSQVRIQNLWSSSQCHFWVFLVLILKHLIQ